MASGTTPYDSQRPRRTPPHVSIGALRNAIGLTLDEACARASEYGPSLTRGALSGIENGHRGASRQTLAALEQAYGLRAGDLTTDYSPSDNARRKAVPA